MLTGFGQIINIDSSTTKLEKTLQTPPVTPSVVSMGSIEDEYEPLEIIGKGSFGTVRKVRLKQDGTILVRKEIEYTSMNTQERNHIISELRILRELNHPYIVKYLRHDHLPEKKAIHIYQEFCDGGDLAKVISSFKRNKQSVPEAFIWEVLVQTLLALHRCHYGNDAKKVDLFSRSGNGEEPQINSETVIIHRDIKPDNIFMLDSGKKIKLGDFGLAKMITSLNDFAKTYVGTPYYMSPEVLMDNPYSPVCDIWSLGCVLYELCNLEPPFQAKTHLQLQMKIKRGVIPDISPNYSQLLRNIINESITVDPNQRPNCYELLETISVKMFRKEMELREMSSTLNEFQKQLLIKNEELKKTEQNVKTLQANVETQRKALQANVDSQRKALQDDYQALQKQCVVQKEQLEKELLEDFELRKRQMDQEAKEMRLNYQREFKNVVEQEVLLRLSELMRNRGNNHMEPSRKKSDSSLSSQERYRSQQHKPKGPREYVEESLHQQQLHQVQHSSHFQHPNPQHPHYPLVQQHSGNIPVAPTARRSPLKNRNSEYDFDVPKTALRPMGYNNYRKRITDEFEQLTLQKRNIPEYEEHYLRQNFRY